MTAQERAAVQPNVDFPDIDEGARPIAIGDVQSADGEPAFTQRQSGRLDAHGPVGDGLHPRGDDPGDNPWEGQGRGGADDR